MVENDDKEIQNSDYHSTANGTEKISPNITRQLITPGTVLDDKYLIEAELGRGGIGVVYKASDKRLHNRLVVIKLLLTESDSNDWLIKKFRHESEALARINHSGIVKVYDRGELENTKPYFVMEFIEGETLRKIIQETEINLNFAAKMLQQLGDALEAAHAEGIVHRDLKPENIMVQKLSGGMEQVKLIDFGIAKVKDPTSANQTTIAMTVGTAHYMAPEQMENGDAMPSSDIFALAVIAYEMLTGKRPFNVTGNTQFAVMAQLLLMHQNADYPKPTELNPNIPEAAETAIIKALSYNPKDRYKSAKEFTDDLAKALVVPTIPNADKALAKEPTPNTVTQPKSFPLPIVIITMLVLVILGFTIFKIINSKPEQVSIIPIPTRQSTQIPIKKTFSYWVMVQKDPKRYSNAKPFRLPGEIIFEKGYQARLILNSPETGFLYLLNEPPSPINGIGKYIILFPKPSVNDGTAELASNQEISIPSQESWMTFDEQEGTEKLWLVWSSQAVPKLEELKHLVNPNDKGLISDEKDVKSVESFITNHTIKKPVVEKDDDKKLTTVKSTEDPLVNLIKIEHH